MFFILLLFVTNASAYPGYAGSSSNSVPNGYGYGYSGSFSGSTGGDSFNPVSRSGFGPVPPPPGDFNVFFNGYFDQLQRYLNDLQQFQHGQVFGPGNFPQQGFNGGTDGSSIAAASIGPKGYTQTAAVYPENPGHPNIFSRFGEVGPSGAGGGGGGNYGVFTSSVSSSATDGDGKTRNYQHATTTVNDNGKVTTYTVKNP